MRRTALIVPLAFGLLAAPLAPGAEEASKVPRIGVLWPTTAGSPRIEEFRQGLRALGYVEGRNLLIEYRYAEADLDRLPGLAAELVRLPVDVIVALSTLVAWPAKDGTTTIPIVMVSGDPVGAALVLSLARPGGNVTGLSFSSPEAAAKRLELLKELLPGLARVAVLWHADGPAKVREFQATEVAAQALGIELHSLEVRAPDLDFDGALGAVTTGRADALLTLGNPVTLSQRTRIVAFAADSRLPSVYDSRQFVEAGGLLSYGPDFSDLYRRAATYVDKILKGARPGDLPVEGPTKFELVINLKTAKALGLAIPQPLLLRADHVIQ
ncbi:MAG: ABC transporter substrate-binding protein [Candidatus Rokubacteria bacterium]|nr:ABC transporter substrate-binding protein [Candidatus Rokubacteria bacterium]